MKVTWASAVTKAGNAPWPPRALSTLPTMALASESPTSPPWSLYLSSQRLLLIQAAVITSCDWTLSSPTPISVQPEGCFAACPTVSVREG